MAPNGNGNDFLFTLNQYSHDSAEASGSGNSQANNSNGATNSSSILAGLNAFTPDDGEMDQNAANNFADQLALWTNANFSFDGPTGHAILLDDEKDEEAKREEREREGERERERERERRERDAAANNDAPSSRRAEKARDGAPHYPLAEPTHHDHKLQADHVQQNQYFAPPSAAAGEGRRPGYGRDEYSRRHAENAAPNGTSRDPNGPNQAQAGAQGQQAPQQTPLQAPENAFPHFGLGANGQPQPIPTTQAPGQAHPQQGAMPLGMSPELLQALAFQQILSGTQAYANPLALAGLLGMPQMPSGYPAGPVANGFPAPFSVQPPMAPHQAQAPANPWAAALSQLPNGAHAQVPGQAQPANSSVHSSPDPPNHQGDGKRDSHSENSSDGSGNEGANGNHNKKRRHSTNKQEESAAAREKREDAELQRVLREEIPPLQLIDTGNPEADAEANRLAIEEDKRRRNTAASARFRVKKKMREQALEQTAKELESRVRDLEEENSRLSTENGWLKSLITIRPGGGPPGSANSSAHGSAHGSPAPSNPFYTAPHQQSQQGQAPPAPSTFTGSGMQPQRDTGLQPRGVGTAAPGGEHSSKAAGSNAPMQPPQHEAPLPNGPAPVASGVKRGRSD